MSSTAANESWVTKVRQHPERAVPDRAQEFLAQGYVAHVGIEQDGRPYVIPMLYHYAAEHPDRLYLHGGLSSRMLGHLAAGVPICATVTQLDGLVYSRDAKDHSANYRCVMCFGRGRLLEDDEQKREMFEAMTLRYFPGRTAGHDYTTAPAAHLATTAVIEVLIEEISAKMREGGPKGPNDADNDAPGTCGVVDLRSGG
ncbi:MAG TPA: pyridoxamine 5'-phosphate oxidase family protein [Terriglobales bacterium]|jgi:nitroimidazol reductase NimA-like FMN-containing flavoprotein (pyridoxamine 5'-phosphate oxidase superfamily)